MPAKIRKTIQKSHRALDGWVGRTFYRLPPLENTIRLKNGKGICWDAFNQYRYSKINHFYEFRLMPVYQGQTPATCDLKVYQDLFVYSFIVDTIKPGSRLLEIGGGNSRVITALKTDYEFWNLDKLEGVGFGPKGMTKPEGYRLVREYIGSHSPELPENYFDLVFSISTVEHFSHNQEDLVGILSDIERLIRPGGISLHCIDALLFSDHYFVHPLVSTIRSQIKEVELETDFETIANDKDLWLLPPFAYYTRWFPLTRKRLKPFGHPFSLNILWRK